jgi:hypothetical protein
MSLTLQISDPREVTEFECVISASLVDGPVPDYELPFVVGIGACGRGQTPEKARCDGLRKLGEKAANDLARLTITMLVDIKNPEELQHAVGEVCALYATQRRSYLNKLNANQP